MPPSLDEPRAPLWPVALFTGVYSVAAVVAAFGASNAEFAIYIGVLFVLMALVVMLHRAIGLSRAALWGLSLWGAAHMAGGLVPVPAGWPIDGSQRVLYSLWLLPGRLKFDQVVHAYGFFVTTCVCWEAWRAMLATRLGIPRRQVRPSAGMLILTATAGMGFGALNEVLEFVTTLLVPETNVGGYENTGWDLVANTVGAASAAVWIGVSSAVRARQGD